MLFLLVHVVFTSLKVVLKCKILNTMSYALSYDSSGYSEVVINTPDTVWSITIIIIFIKTS